MHLKNLNKIELDHVLELISETELRSIINEDVSNRKSYMAYFKKSKFDKITKEEIVQYIYKFTYEKELNKNLLNAVTKKIAEKVIEIDAEGVLDKALLLFFEGEKEVLNEEKISQLNQYKASFNDIGFVLGFDACSRLANKKILIPPEIPDINTERFQSNEQEMLERTFQQLSTKLQKLEKEFESLIPKSDLLNYKNEAQKEIKDLRKEVKNLNKELQLSKNINNEEQKKSYTWKRLSVMPDQIKKISNDLAITEEDNLKAIWNKVSDKELELIAKFRNGTEERKQDSEYLSHLLAFKYIIMKINEGEGHS
jgi:hypothetical protein